MKKLLPLLLFVLLAFAGCHHAPATYQVSNNSHEVAFNAENFAKQVAKHSKRYSAEEWQVAIEQFTAMSKDFVEKRAGMTEDEIMRFDNARLQFMSAVDANGGEALVAQVKEIYGRIMQ